MTSEMILSTVWLVGAVVIFIGMRIWAHITDDYDWDFLWAASIICATWPLMVLCAVGIGIPYLLNKGLTILLCKLIPVRRKS